MARERGQNQLIQRDYLSFSNQRAFIQCCDFYLRSFFRGHQTTLWLQEEYSASRQQTIAGDCSTRMLIRLRLMEGGTMQYTSDISTERSHSDPLPNPRRLIKSDHGFRIRWCERRTDPKRDNIEQEFTYRQK